MENDMKILFLHLSDAHLRDNTMLSQINTGAIVRSLAQMGEFDECVLIFSGDIVQEINDKYFDGKKHIHVMVVPGNHDNVVIAPYKNI